MRGVMTAIALAAGLGGCATLTRGTTDEVAVISDPAAADVTTSFGSRCTTPCSLSVKRDQEFSLVVSKPGYEQQRIAVTTRLASAGAAVATENVVTGGLGLAVDAATGATLEHQPNPVNVTLIQHAATPARKARHVS